MDKQRQFHQKQITSPRLAITPESYFSCEAKSTFCFIVRCKSHLSARLILFRFFLCFDFAFKRFAILLCFNFASRFLLRFRHIRYLLVVVKHSTRMRIEMRTDRKFSFHKLFFQGTETRKRTNSMAPINLFGRSEASVSNSDSIFFIDD